MWETWESNNNLGGISLPRLDFTGPEFGPPPPPPKGHSTRDMVLPNSFALGSQLISAFGRNPTQQLYAPPQQQQVVYQPPPGTAAAGDAPVSQATGGLIEGVRRTFDGIGSAFGVSGSTVGLFAGGILAWKLFVSDPPRGRR